MLYTATQYLLSTLATLSPRLHHMGLRWRIWSEYLGSSVHFCFRDQNLILGPWADSKKSLLFSLVSMVIRGEISLHQLSSHTREHGSAKLRFTDSKAKLYRWLVVKLRFTSAALCSRKAKLSLGSKCWKPRKFHFWGSSGSIRWSWLA
jgi:hypothetical protein